MPLLEARSLTKRFGGVSALDGLDLSIEPGDVIGVMGPKLGREEHIAQDAAR